MTATPCGAPVDPLVYSRYARSLSLGCFGSLGGGELGGFADATSSGFPFLATATRTVLTHDVDSDGDTDVLIGVDEGGSAALPVPNGDVLLLNNGLGVFADESGRLPATSAGDGPLALADVDLDGDRDLVELAPGASRVALWSGQTESFDVLTPAVSSYEPLPAGELAVADLDLDGDDDLIHAGGLWRNLRRELSVAGTTSVGSASVAEISGLGPTTVWVLGYALQPAWVALPPLGQLGLDLTAGFQIFGSGPVNPSEPALVSVPVPDEASLVGIEVWWQAMLDFDLHLTRAVTRTIDDL